MGIPVKLEEEITSPNVLGFEAFYGSGLTVARYNIGQKPFLKIEVPLPYGEVMHDNILAFGAVPPISARAILQDLFFPGIANELILGTYERLGYSQK